MATNMAIWDSHDWFIREVELEANVPLMQHICRSCGRNFVLEFRTSELYAVHVGAVRFDRLSAETSRRWLDQPCPDRRLPSDEADLRTRFNG